MSKFRKNPGAVPERWLHCPRKAADLIINKFMAFKTPLSNNFDSLVPPECRFPPKMLFELCRTKKVKFGLWIDLTNTNRFYDKEEVENENCKYVKLQCRGHGEPPSVEQTDAFLQLVDNFIANKPLEAIAVHCTHGFNRTGFLIVSYLVVKTDCSLEIALEMFSKSRPPGIYKSHYIQELYSRYEGVEDAPPAPGLPDWCFDGENKTSNGSDDESFSEGASTSSTVQNGNRKHRNKILTRFMEGVRGVHIVESQSQVFHLQKKIQNMCEWRSKDFPGCQPVSMDLNNIKLLREKPYRVSWKADGTRYMLLINGDKEVYFFDRDNNVFRVEGLRFPYRKDPTKHLQDTLLDGEMVIDKVNGEAIPRYLVYDIIKINGQDASKWSFYPTRLQCLDAEIIRPRQLAMESGLINKSHEPFSVRKKDFWEITQAENLLGEKFAKNLSHEPDGLIFQPSKDAYTPGRCDSVLKWKPLDMNSVDFKMKIVKESREGCISQKVICLYVGQLGQPFARMKYTKSLKDYDNKIVECKFENNTWKFMRERTDKSFPNGFNTAQAVCGSIKNPVTKEKLLQFIYEHRYHEDSEMMPPPQKKIRRLLN